MSVLEALKSADWFKSMDVGVLEVIAERMERKAYAGDAEVIHETREQDRFFVVENGTLLRSKHGVMSNEVFASGSVLGLLHVFHGDPVYATIRAGAGGANLLEMQRSVLLELFGAHPAVARELLSVFAGSLRNYSRQQRVAGAATMQGASSSASTSTQVSACSAASTPTTMTTNPSASSSSASLPLTVVFFDIKPYEVDAFQAAAAALRDHGDGACKGVEMRFKWVDQRLSEATVLQAQGADAVCIFVNDACHAEVVDQLTRLGVQCILLRCAGYNHVDIVRASFHQLPVMRVPAYSPYAVAEHAVALMLTLNRKTHLAYARTRDANFALRGLEGFDMHGKTVGVIGTGKIGRCLVSIVRGFGCRVLLHDAFPDAAYAESVGAAYVRDVSELWPQCDVLSVHVPLLPSTRHLINAESIAAMKRGVMLINTSRGAIVDTRALIAGLRSGQVGYAGLDVYEDERPLFFEDHSGDVLSDEVLAALTSFRNVLLTGHQAFLTREALAQIASTSLQNLLAVLGPLPTPYPQLSTTHPNFVRNEY